MATNVVSFPAHSPHETAQRPPTQEISIVHVSVKNSSHLKLLVQ